MRQLVAFLEKIRVRTNTEEYYHRKFFAQLHGAEMPFLEEVLGVASEDEENSFNEQTNKELDERALRLLEERRAQAKCRTIS